MATEIRQAGTLGLNGIFYAVSEVGGAVLTVAVEGTKMVGTIAKDVVTTVVDKTAGETSKPAAFVRGSLDATGAVGSIMLDVANAGVRGAGQAGQVVFATAISTVGGVATDAVVATGTAVTKAVFDTVGTVADKASQVASKAQ